MNIASKLFANRPIAFPYIYINGYISRQTQIFQYGRTVFVENMLKKLPSKTSKLGIVINSKSGSLAQAHIINTKLNLLSKKRNIQLYTFIEQNALNAGFLLASNGHKIFADSVSIIGGLQVSTRKLVLGDMIERITYKNEPSVSSQLNNTQNIDPSKKQQLQRVFSEFSQHAGSEIRKARKTNESIDLKDFFTAKEAKQHGLIDEIGRINQVVSYQLPQYELRKLQQGQLDRIKHDLRRLNVW